MTKLEQARKLLAEAAKVTRSADLCYRAAANAMASDAVRQYAALLDVVEAAQGIHIKRDRDGQPVITGMLALSKAVRKWEEMA
jgi:hypothetical protein